MKILAVLLLSCALVACGPDPDTAMRKESPTVSSSARVSVTRIGVVEDDLAYGNRRGIYVIQDGATGKEFIGVSGVGIAEVGSHRNGKQSSEDER